MKIQVAVALVSSLVALTTAAAPSSGAPQAGASAQLSFLTTGELHAPKGGASRAPHGYMNELAFPAPTARRWSSSLSCRAVPTPCRR